MFPKETTENTNYMKKNRIVHLPHLEARHELNDLMDEMVKDNKGSLMPIA